MGANNDKGANAERRVAEKVNGIQDGHNVLRIGGIERRKWVYPGDIACVKKSKNGKEMCEYGDECIWDNYCFEVKMRKGKSVPKWWEQTVNQSPTNRIPVLIWWKNHGNWRVREGSTLTAYDDYTLEEWVKMMEEHVEEEEKATKS